MSKEDNINFLRTQTYVLKVNIHCDGCKAKVKKLLKIDGVYTTSIDAEQGTVTVSGIVDPATLIKKLNKGGKHAELWAPKGSHNLNNQFQKLQLGTGKGQQKDNGKPQKVVGVGKDQNGQHPPPNQQHQLLQQMKGFKDLKLPLLKDLKLPFQKGPKSVKFSLPPEDYDDGSDYDDEFDDFLDDEDFDDMDGIDDDFDEDLKQVGMKPMNTLPVGNGLVNDKKGGGGNGKKGGGGGGEIPVQIKGIGGNNDRKNANGGGKKGGGGNQNQGGGGKNGGGVQDANKGGTANKGAGGGNSGNNNNNSGQANGGNKKGGAKNHVGGGQPMPNPHMPNPHMPMGQGYPRMDVGNMHAPVGAHMGNFPVPGGAVQGLPAGPPPDYFQPGMVPPEMVAAGNPYQQQYIAALMQQQRMMNGPYPPMGYARPQPPPMPYMPPPPPAGEPLTHFFSDENTNSCAVM